MHLSIPSTPTQVSSIKINHSLADNGAQMDLNSPRYKLVALLQKEQDEAMTLLDANPFVTSLLIKYSESGIVKPSSTENEELIALRAANNAIRQDYERLKADYETVNQQKKAANMFSEGLEIKLASTIEEKKKLFEENEALKASLKDSQTEVAAGLDHIFEMKVGAPPRRSKLC
jgi:hypothetical protein